MCDNIFYPFSAGIPRKFTFEMSNDEEFWKEYPEYETFNRFLNLSGSYELHGFGRYAGGQLKMRSTVDGLHELTPIWKKIYTGTDSQFFIFFNHTRSRWELHEKERHDKESNFTKGYDHIFCKTGFTNQFSLFYEKFRRQPNAHPWLLDYCFSRSERSDQSRF